MSCCRVTLPCYATVSRYCASLGPASLAPPLALAPLEHRPATSLGMLSLDQYAALIALGITLQCDLGPFWGCGEVDEGLGDGFNCQNTAMLHV